MDEQPIEVFRVVNGTDTTFYTVDKQIIEHYLKINQPDNFHTLEMILPVLAVILYMVIKELLNFWSDNRKYKREILKETRSAKIKYLSYLNKYKVSLEKPKFPDANLEDFYDWTANSVIVQNPFEDIKIQGNIVFNDNKEILNIINDLYYDAENIRNDFNFNTREHSRNAVKSAHNIINNLKIIIEKISQNLNEV